MLWRARRRHRVNREIVSRAMAASAAMPTWVADVSAAANRARHCQALRGSVRAKFVTTMFIHVATSAKLPTNLNLWEAMNACVDDPSRWSYRPNCVRRLAGKRPAGNQDSRVMGGAGVELGLDHAGKEGTGTAPRQILHHGSRALRRDAANGDGAGKW